MPRRRASGHRRHSQHRSRIARSPRRTVSVRSPRHRERVPARTTAIGSDPPAPGSASGARVRRRRRPRRQGARSGGGGGALATAEPRPGLTGGSAPEALPSLVPGPSVERTARRFRRWRASTSRRRTAGPAPGSTGCVPDDTVRKNRSDSRAPPTAATLNASPVSAPIPTATSATAIRRPIAAASGLRQRDQTPDR